MKNKKKETKSKSFTVIELLVVIALIGLLATIILISVSEIKRRGVDSKTITQLSQVPSASSLAYTIDAKYDSICNTATSFSDNSGLLKIQEDIESRGGSIQCYADGNNYCISTELSTGEHYVIKNDLRLNSSVPCLSAKTGGGYYGDLKCGDNFTDTRDSKTYATVQIGNQCWMQENLAYLPTVHNNADFATEGTASRPGYGVYGYNGSDVSNAEALPNYSKYGVLYNWFAALTACPPGWHLPTDAEMHILDLYLTTSGNTCVSTRNGLWDCDPAGSRMKGQDTAYGAWQYGNSSGFTALPAGYRYTGGSFGNIGSHAFFWSSSESAGNALRRYLIRTEARVFRGASSKAGGLSVRCLRD